MYEFLLGNSLWGYGWGSDCPVRTRVLESNGSRGTDYWSDSCRSGSVVWYRVDRTSGSGRIGVLGSTSPVPYRKTSRVPCPKSRVRRHVTPEPSTLWAPSTRGLLVV